MVTGKSKKLENLLEYVCVPRCRSRLVLASRYLFRLRNWRWGEGDPPFAKTDQATAICLDLWRILGFLCQVLCLNVESSEHITSVQAIARLIHHFRQCNNLVDNLQETILDTF